MDILVNKQQQRVREFKAPVVVVNVKLNVIIINNLIIKKVPTDQLEFNGSLNWPLSIFHDFVKAELHGKLNSHLNEE